MKPPHPLHHVVHQTNKAKMENSQFSSPLQPDPAIVCILISLLLCVIGGYSIVLGVVLLSYTVSEFLVRSNIHQRLHENDGGPSNMPHDYSGGQHADARQHLNHPLDLNYLHHRLTNTLHTLWQLFQSLASEIVHPLAHGLPLFDLISFVQLATKQTFSEDVVLVRVFQPHVESDHRANVTQHLPLDSVLLNASHGDTSGLSCVECARQLPQLPWNLISTLELTHLHHVNCQRSRLSMPGPVQLQGREISMLNHLGMHCPSPR